MTSAVPLLPASAFRESRTRSTAAYQPPCTTSGVVGRGQACQEAWPAPVGDCGRGCCAGTRKRQIGQSVGGCGGVGGRGDGRGLGRKRPT